MAQANANLEWKVPDPKKLVYKIQEAFASATALGIKPYDELRNKWRIKLKGPTVIAEFVYGADSMPSSLTFNNISDSLDIIETIIRHKTLDFDLLFPHLSQVDEMLSDYINANNYQIEPTPAGMLIKLKENNNASPRAS